jgi:uncharacterized protein with FMN-binding domain
MGKENISNKTLAKGLAAGVVVVASLGALQVGEYSTSTSSANDAAPVLAQGSGSYVAGTYTASAAGISSDVTVSVTFDETSITDITVDVSGETAGIGADIGDEMIEKFLASQGSNVDGVSGATITSDALKSAVSDCIVQASSGEGPSEDASVEADTQAETEAVTETAVTEAETDAEAETDDNQTDAATGTDSYTAGTYTASAKGISSDIAVSVTFDNTSITEITADVSGETAGIGADAGDPMIESILAAQSVDVDGVTGATITSDAIKTAVADCIAQASVSEAAADQTVYTASAKGISSDVTVEMTVDGSEITDVSIDVSGETAGIGADIGDQMADAILSAQSADVDGVTGATVTSDAVKTAAADCLAQAGIAGAEAETESDVDAVSEATTEAESDVDAVSEATTEAESETVSEAAETETESETASEVIETETDSVIVSRAAAEAESDVDAVSEATTEAESDVDAVSEATTEAESESEYLTSIEYVPGTYTASAKGISSDITVTMTFDADGITAVTADVSGETAGIGADIEDEIVKEILDAQSADVDGITGATVSSDAVKAAAADCIAQAVVESESETEAESQVAGGYTAGTYTASAKGISSNITVTMTFDADGITKVTADVSGETAGIGADIEDEITKAILDAQSADVDGITGATVTSDAVKTAAADCIAQAQGE